jgi:hypothetical protein
MTLSTWSIEAAWRWEISVTEWTAPDIDWTASCIERRVVLMLLESSAL